MIVTCGIIEDESLGRELLARYISRIPDLKVKWIRESLAELLSGGIHQEDFVDIVFLDLQNAVSSGSINSDQSIEKYGQIIVTTAYPEKFVKTLPIHYRSILNKPYSFDTFYKTVMETVALLGKR